MRAYTDTRDRVARLLAEGLTVAETARALGITSATVCYHKRRLGYPMGSGFTRRYDWTEVQRYYAAGHSVRDCYEHFGMASKTFYDAVRRGDVITRPPGAPMEEVFARGRRRNRNHLKRRLLRAGIKDYCCEECGLTQWRDKPLPLQLHHVNGDPLDHRVENLLLLCANCHSQTDNWGGRNARRRAA
jgi:hypothetical protein